MLKTKKKSLLLTLGTMLVVVVAMFGGFLLVGNTTTNSSAQVKADETLASGDNWVLSGDGTLTISGSGELPYWNNSSSPPWYAQRNNITSVIIGEGITRVGRASFKDCTNITSVTILNSDIRIDYDPFAGNVIENILFTTEAYETWGSAVYAKYDFINGVMKFYNESYRYFEQDLEDYVDMWDYTGGYHSCYASLVKSIELVSGGDSFARGLGCGYTYSNLTSIKIGSSIRNISDYQFGTNEYSSEVYTPNLREIEIEGKNLNISKNAFYGCKFTRVKYEANGTGYTFKDGLLTVTNMDLSWQNDGISPLVQEIVIADSITRIENNAFVNMPSLVSVTIGRNINYVGSGAFYSDAYVAPLNIYVNKTASDFSNMHDAKFYVDLKQALTDNDRSAVIELVGSERKADELLSMLTATSPAEVAAEYFSVNYMGYKETKEGLAEYLTAHYNSLEDMTSYMEENGIYDKGMEASDNAKYLIALYNALLTGNKNRVALAMNNETYNTDAYNTADDLISQLEDNTPAEIAVDYIFDGAPFDYSSVPAMLEANNSTGIRELIIQNGFESMADKIITMLMGIYNAINKTSIDRVEVASLFVNEEDLNNAQDLLSLIIRNTPEEVVELYKNNLSINEISIDYITSILNSLKFEPEDDDLENEGELNSAFGYEILENNFGVYNDKDVANYNAPNSDDIRPVVLHYDSSLASSFETVFDGYDSVSYDDSYEVPAEPETPETGIAVNLTVLSVGLVIGIVAMAVLRKKEQY